MAAATSTPSRRRRRALQAAAVLVAVAGACAVVAPREELADRLPACAWPDDLPAAQGWRALRTAVHVHTEASHDAHGSIAEVASAAAAVGVDVVIVTDHRNRDQGRYEGWHGPVLVIVGQELSGGSHVLAIGQRQAVEHRHAEPRRELIARIAAAGAISVAAHPARRPRPDTPEAVAAADGIEVYSLSTDTLGQGTWGLLATFVRLNVGAVRAAVEGAVRPPTAALRLWDEQLARRPCVGLSAADSHGTYGLSHAASLRTAQTHVLVREASREAVVEALRAGRCYGTVELFAPVPYFWFQVAWGDDAALMGATRPWADGAEASVRLPAAATIRLLRDGVVVREAQADRLRCSLPGPGVYRVEAWLGERLWIFSNAIRLLVSPTPASGPSPPAGRRSEPGAPGGAPSRSPD